MSKINTEETLGILAESAITFGLYQPSDEFIEGNSIAILLEDKPIVMLGYEGCQQSQAVAERLLESMDFLKLVSYKFGNPLPLELKIGVVSNAQTLKDYGVYSEYQAIVDSEQGVSEDGTGAGSLEAVLLPPNAKDVSFGYAMCVSNEMMKAFVPDAKDLSRSIAIKDEAVENKGNTIDFVELNKQVREYFSSQGTTIESIFRRIANEEKVKDALQ